MGDDSLLAWLTHDRTLLFQKDPRNIIQRKLSFNHMSPTNMETFNRSDRWRDAWLPWKVETLGGRTKSYSRGNRGTKDQLLIDKTVLEDCKKRHHNLSLTRERMTLFHIAGSMSVWSYLELQITWETFSKTVWSNGSYR